MRAWAWMLCVSCGYTPAGDGSSIVDFLPDEGQGSSGDTDAASLVPSAPLQAIVRHEPRQRVDFRASCADGEELCDVTIGAGLHRAPRAYGRGASIVDVDGDGLEDIWQGHALNDHLGDDRGGVLWRNRGDGAFDALDLGIPLEHSRGNWGAAWADWDNDGDPDVLLTNGGYDGTGRLHLYRNDLSEHGVFTEVTAASGITQQQWAWWGAAFADFNRDGHLDIVITARSLFAIPPCCAESYEQVTDEVEAPVLLYRSRGDGTFEEVSTSLGIRPSPIDAHQPVWWDYDQDGWPDLFVPNMGDWSTYAPDEVNADPKDAHVALYRNVDGVRFQEVTHDVLPPYITQDAPVFGVAPLDVDQDGVLDLYAGRGWLQAAVLRNLGGGQLEVLGREIGLDNSQDPRAPENTMGLNVGDLTGDGYPEIMVGPGSPNLMGEAVLFRNLGAAGEVGFDRPADAQPRALYGHHHGSALGDLDQDGNVDVFWNMGGFGRYDEEPFKLPPGVDPTTVDSRAYPVLQVGNQAAARTAALRLEGTVSSRDPIGARVKVTGSETRWYWVEGTVGFQSRNSPWITVALGDADQAEVVVNWPSGLRTVNTIGLDDRIWLVEPTL